MADTPWYQGVDPASGGPVDYAPNQQGEIKGKKVNTSPSVVQDFMNGLNAIGHFGGTTMPNTLQRQALGLIPFNDPTVGGQALRPNDTGKKKGGKNKAAAAAAGPQPTSNPTATAQPSNVDDALTMGLGMFFQQYLAPMMAMQSQVNNNLIGQWGGAMQNALKQPMPEGVKQVLQASYPQQAQLLSMENQAGLQQAAGAGNFQQLMQELGGQTSATQALQDAFQKAATYQELGAGSPASLATVLQGALGGNSTLAGALASLLGTGGGVGGLLPNNPAVASALNTAATANQAAGAGYTPPKP